MRKNKEKPSIFKDDKKIDGLYEKYKSKYIKLKMSNQH